MPYKKLLVITQLIFFCCIHAAVQPFQQPHPACFNYEVFQHQSSNLPATFLNTALVHYTYLNILTNHNIAYQIPYPNTIISIGNFSAGSIPRLWVNINLPNLFPNMMSLGDFHQTIIRRHQYHIPVVNNLTMLLRNEIILRGTQALPISGTPLYASLTRCGYFAPIMHTINMLSSADFQQWTAQQFLAAGFIPNSFVLHIDTSQRSSKNSHHSIATNNGTTNSTTF